MTVREQIGTTCCYAKADKFWVHDADGMQWEMYSVLEDAEVHSLPRNACCAPASQAPVDAPLVQIQERSCC